MKSGDRVICKGRGEAVILHVYEDSVSVLFLKNGMYNPEFFSKKDVEVINEPG